ncbi:MAG: 50S ribosomal protein L17 [Fibrobacterales bacterium]
MRHGVKKFKLNRTASHRKAMLKNLATSIIKQGIAEDQMDRQVKTTVIKAKAVRGLVDRLVTYAKKGDLSSRRQAAKFIQEPAVLQDLFEKVGPRYADRQGGYTRILKLSANRKGDNAEMAIITLVDDEVTKKEKKPAKKAAPTKEIPKVEASTEEIAE